MIFKYIVNYFQYIVLQLELKRPIENPINYYKHFKKYTEFVNAAKKLRRKIKQKGSWKNTFLTGDGFPSYTIFIIE